MKVTPLDIRRKEFKRSVRGYSDEEVDLFLDEVADEFERVFQENVELQDRVRRQEEQLAGNAQMRDALEKTLISAQLQADQTRANAQKESELILRDAELKARGIVNDSYGEVQRVQQALIQLKRLEEDFRFKFRSLLEGHLKLLEDAPLDMGGRPVLVEPAAAAAEESPETPFVVPAAFEEVPEYVGHGQEVAQAQTAAAPETTTGILAAAAAGLAAAPAVPAAEQPAMSAAASPPAQPAPEAEPVVAAAPSSQVADIWPADGATAETVELAGAGGVAPGLPADDPLSGFFFGGRPDGADDPFLDGGAGGKSKARDFEW
jgi:cell division initiation protein